MMRFNDMTTQSVNYGADVRRRLINVDASYRESVGVRYYDNAGALLTQNSPTDFTFKLTTPVRNVHGFKVTSIELTGVTFTGNYLLLQINGESSIESQGASGTEVRAVAKILKRPVTDTNASVIFGDTFGLISAPVVFRNPQDVTILRVRLLNSDGTVAVGTSAADAGDNNIVKSTAKVSFTLELQETLNSYLYESQRKHIGFNPANA